MRRTFTARGALSGAAAFLMLAGVDAYAADDASAKRDPSQPVEEIVITGSHLKRPETDTPSPVEVISSEALHQSGYTSTQEVLSSLTANGQGTLSQGFSGAFAGGAAGVSLRGLSVGSTLVLIDGHRSAPYPIGDDGQRSFVDISNLPFEAVERVEVLKDGASAVYGSDAIAGVVNIILKPSYEGMSLGAERGRSDRGDGDQVHLSGIWGVGDLDKTGRNFYVSAEFRHQNAIRYADRGGIFTQTDFSGSGGENVTLGTKNVIAGNNPQSPTGYVLDNRDPNNVVKQFLPGCNQTSFDAGMCSYTDNWNQLQPNTQNFNLVSRFTQNFADNWQFSVDGGYFRSQAEQVRAPSATFPRGYQGLRLGPGIPPSFVDTLPLTTIPSTNPSFPKGLDPALARAPVYYTFLNIGNRINETDARTYRAVANLTGQIGEWDVESAFGYTRVNLDRDGLNIVNPTNLQLALNSTTDPFLIGQANSATVVNFVAPKVSQRNTSELGFIHGGVSRSLFDLPGGPVGIALGFDYFKREQNATAPSQVEQGLLPGFSNSFALGTQRVTSGYFEVALPVLQDLSFDGAVRYDSYNISGGRASPKIGVRWQALPMLALRGTASKGFRAPGPSENGTAGQTFAAGASPDPVLCPNPGTPMAPGNFVGQCSVRVPGLQSTNSRLNPETSESFTLGFIVEPLEQITASMDFYNLKIDDQIVSGGDTARVRGTNLAPIERYQPDGSIKMEAPSVAPIAYDTISFVNANSTETNGFDLRLVYQDEFAGIGALKSEALWSFTNKYDLTVAGQTYKLAGTHGPFFFTGDTGNPKSRIQWKNTISRGAWEVSGTLNFIDSFKVTDPSSEAFNSPPQNTCLEALTASGAASRDYQTQLAAGNIPGGVDCRVDSFTTFDVNTKYDMTENLTFRASILNLFDTEAPRDYETYGGAGGNVPFNPSFHTKGAIGRFFTVGVNYRFW